VITFTTIALGKPPRYSVEELPTQKAGIAETKNVASDAQKNHLSAKNVSAKGRKMICRKRGKNYCR
jgi:hypothetical protein